MHLVRILNWLSKNWNKKDEGIWEVRGGKQHFVYSKVFIRLIKALILHYTRLCVGSHLIVAFDWLTDVHSLPLEQNGRRWGMRYPLYYADLFHVSLTGSTYMRRLCEKGTTKKKNVSLCIMAARVWMPACLLCHWSFSCLQLTQGN